MSGQLGEWVNGLAKDFNASQSLQGGAGLQGHLPRILCRRHRRLPCRQRAARAAGVRGGHRQHDGQQGRHRAGGRGHEEGRRQFDASVYVPAVSGYYTAPNGQMLSFPFNSSTTVLHYNKDAFKAAGLDPNSPPKTWPEVALAAAKLKASGHKCPFTTAWQSWTQLESFSAWHNVEFATQRNGFNGLNTRLAITTPLHVRHIENLANMAQQGLFVYKGRNNAADATFQSGECARCTPARRRLRRHQAQLEGRGRHQHPALLPRRARRAAEHRDRRRQPVGDVRQEARGVQGRGRVLQVPVRRAGAGQPATRAPATCRSPRGLQDHRGQRLLQEEPRHRRQRDADDPQDHRQVARHPAGQLRADPHHHRRRARAGVGRQEDAKEGLETIKKRGDVELEKFEKANKG
jgi:sn-glycerol 3-phosphate transport system substrate-binding protein